METLKELESKAIIEMGQIIERQRKELEQLRIRVAELEKQIYGSR
jgi:uncharacterized coiled-coil protein SlyX